MVIKMYQKEIIYMSLYNNDIKEGCVGYFKLEKRQNQITLNLQVKNIPDNIAGNFPLRLQVETGWQETDMITIKDGMGRWTGSITEQVLRVEMILSDSYKIKGQSKSAPIINAPKDERQTGTQEQALKQEPPHKPQEQPPRQEPSHKPQGQLSGQEPSYKPQEQLSSRESSHKPQQQLSGQEPGRQKPSYKLQEPSSRPKDSLRSLEQPPRQELPARAVQIIEPGRTINSENVPLYESKWEQLLSAYEQIRPYGDDRVYVKLKPKDFIILRSNYQHLVNNSFLLHGFYNYRYLILGKEKDFYLGVPGVFYEREKMVALMFGFEAFECEGGIAEEGKFGYYLRKVEL